MGFCGKSAENSKTSPNPSWPGWRGVRREGKNQDIVSRYFNPAPKIPALGIQNHGVKGGVCAFGSGKGLGLALGISGISKFNIQILIFKV